MGDTRPSEDSLRRASRTGVFDIPNVDAISASEIREPSGRSLRINSRIRSYATSPSRGLGALRWDLGVDDNSINATRRAHSSGFQPRTRLDTNCRAGTGHGH